MKRQFLLSTALTALVLTGCVGAGTQFEFDQARQVRVGMTESQLVDLMGKPFQVSAQGNRQVWVWSYTSPSFATRTVSFVLENGAVVETPTIPESFGK